MDLTKEEEILKQQFDSAVESIETTLSPSKCEVKKGGVFPMEKAKNCFAHFMGLGDHPLPKPTIQVLLQENSLYGIIMKIHQPVTTDPDKSFYRLSMESMMNPSNTGTKLEKVNTLCVKIGFSLDNSEYKRTVLNEDKSIHIPLRTKSPLRKMFVKETDIVSEVFTQNYIAMNSAKEAMMPCTPYVVYSEKFELCDFDRLFEYFYDDTQDNHVEELFLSIKMIFNRMQRKYQNSKPTLHITVMEFLDDMKNIYDWMEYEDEYDVDENGNRLNYQDKKIIGGVSTIYQLLESVATSGFIHMDLHLGNAMIRPKTREIKLIDFGKVVRFQGPEYSKFLNYYRHYYYPDAIVTLVSYILKIDPPYTKQNADGSTTRIMNNTAKQIKQLCFKPNNELNDISFDIMHSYHDIMEEYGMKVKATIGVETFKSYMKLNKKLNDYYFNLLKHKTEHVISFPEIKEWIEELKLPQLDRRIVANEYLKRNPRTVLRFPRMMKSEEIEEEEEETKRQYTYPVYSPPNESITDPPLKKIKTFGGKRNIRNVSKKMKKNAAEKNREKRQHRSATTSKKIGGHRTTSKK
jgi:hypothetical protein